jgi:hypothetical protein
LALDYLESLKANEVTEDHKVFTVRVLDRILEMAWDDRTPFNAILFQFGISKKEVIKLMRVSLKELSLNFGLKE